MYMAALCHYEGFKVFITYMADSRHNRRDESRFKNSHLLRLSYKTQFIIDTFIKISWRTAPQRI
ncbi:hypothetical protein MTBBW1_80094 [Desulfamplus magnetovallimortis]|uniref:Uncharacterized protein n=1 Tax=Desulfamplus magnetovallimortis TaxID=1246637 RepID=L0R571_9BACT|nr:hypothetical protein DEMABW1_80094 [Desulfamplus magnetovallimortis BW-1]SLM32753.1 hypothetical protein MTBBW1_80094 [Desulfamplus magnetovallimortis]